MAAAARARRAFRPFARLRVPEGRDPGLFWRAINRLSAAHAVAQWRVGAGEAPSLASAARYVEIVADALRHADGSGHRYKFDAIAVREHWLPPAWGDCITDDEIYAVILDVERTRTPDDLMGAREAGRLLGLHLGEVEAMRAGGTNVPFVPVDLSAAEHEVMRLEHKRAGARERSRRYRASRNLANDRHAAPSKGDRDADCKVPATQEAAVHAAISAGAAKVADIVRMTGIPATTVYPLLTRLLAACSIRRTGRGTYTPEPHEQPSEVRSDIPAPARVESTGRAPDAPALRPRLPVFSRLPSTVFNIAAWRTNNASPRCA